MSELESKIKLLPTNPGVYIMQDENGVIIYVGKAKNLKNRVTQYFRNGYKTNKVAAMVSSIKDFYYVITTTEADALSLENNLIKKHKPKYNILLKDDKSYPYLRVDLKEKYPRFTITRRVKNDGARYFGPYMLGVSVSNVLDILKDAYKVRPCVKNLEKPSKECLNYHIGLCDGPCARKISEEDYLKNIYGAIDFLLGNDQSAEKILNEKMLSSAENEEFERAILYKERLTALQKIKEKNITALPKSVSFDVVAIKSNGIYASISVLFVRNGKAMGVSSYSAETLTGSDGERVNEFLLRFYAGDRELPKEVVLNCEVDLTVEEKISEIYGRKTTFTTPKKGVKLGLLQMAETNANEYLDKVIDKLKHKSQTRELALDRLKELLSLKKRPYRIECFDISHISGVDKVGSMTVFVNAEPSKNDYRRFKIKTVVGNDDFASLQEVLRRRLSKLGTSEEEKFPKPDLIVIDGGKGQLSSVNEIFKQFKVNDIDLISLAEREEEIYTLFSNEPIRLSRNDVALKTLIRIRDEAHRFAITFNRNLRNKRTLKSMLTEIEGIGEKKRNALIDKFKDINGLISATVEELQTVEGIGEKQAQKIKEFLTKNGSN